MRAAACLLLIVLTGCASRPVFEDVPAAGAAHKRVMVESRIEDEAAVRSTCSWKQREAGVRVFEGAPGCTFMERGQFVILWTDPKTFTNRAAMEVAGHELYHRHNLKDHK